MDRPNLLWSEWSVGFLGKSPNIICFVWYTQPSVYHIRYEMNKYNTYELMVSERVATVDSKALDEDVVSFVKKQPSSFRILSMREKGQDKGLWHTHMCIHFDTKTPPKITTFRSQIQKHFGKSNTKYDWKLRCVRLSIEKFLKYITKGSDVLCQSNFDMGLYEKHKGTYKPTPKQVSAKTTIQKVQKYFIRCEECYQWEHQSCKKCSAKAVIRYYKEEDKIFDEFRMRNIVKTFYYWDKEDELLDKLVDF